MSETSILNELMTKMEALQATVEQQQNEIKRLNAAQVATETVSPTAKTTSRRKLLKRLAAVAAGAAATTTALAVSSHDASAGTGTSGSNVGFYNFIGNNGSETGIPNGVSTVGFAGSSGASFGGNPGGNPLNAGVLGVGNIVGNNTPHGVYGRAFGTSGKGVFGTGAAIGVEGSTSTGIGVYGSIAGDGNAGVAGRVAGNSDNIPPATGVAGIGTSRGVYGSALLGNGGGGDIYGVSANAALPPNVGGASTAYAVYGNASVGSTSDANQTAIGVYGNASTYGGSFSGFRAPIYLTPSGNANPPTTGTHQFGELYVDTTSSNSGNLYFCAVAGTPGTWVKLNSNLVAGANITLTSNPNGTTTIASTGGGGGAGVSAINNLTGSVTFQSGSGINLTNNGNTITIASTGAGGAGVSAINSLAGNVTLQAGSGVNLTSNGNTITIASTGTGGAGVSAINNLAGNINLLAGSGVNLTSSGNNITIAATGSGGNGSNITFLSTPIRVAIVAPNSAGALTSDGSSNLAPRDIQVVGTNDLNGSGLSVPAGAKGIVGSLTSVGATTSGNLRLWPTGGAKPVVNTLNIPAKPDGTGFNLTTSVMVGLGTGGKVSIAFSGGANSKCGYALDIAGYIL